MEKSMTSGVLEPLGRIICKKINPLKYVSSEKYNIAKVKNKKIKIKKCLKNSLT